MGERKVNLVMEAEGEEEEDQDWDVSTMLRSWAIEGVEMSNASPRIEGSIESG